MAVCAAFSRYLSTGANRRLAPAVASRPDAGPFGPTDCRTTAALRAAVQLCQHTRYPSLGSYRIARLLGMGGMGEVCLGVQPEIGSRVAIKLLTVDAARAPTIVERFFAEARAVNVIRHEGIVSILDLARLPDGRPYIVMPPMGSCMMGTVRPPRCSVKQVLDRAGARGKGTTLVYGAGGWSVIVEDQDLPKLVGDDC